jgi:hypothetical protein
MTSGITYTEENGFVFLPGFRQSLFTPRVPVNWVVFVLQEIRGGFNS